VKPEIAAKPIYAARIQNIFLLLAFVVDWAKSAGLSLETGLLSRRMTLAIVGTITGNGCQTAFQIRRDSTVADVKLKYVGR
jgi:hypothetical protein